MHKGCGESYEFSAVEEVEQQKGSGAWQFWCMAVLLELVHWCMAALLALLELVHGSHPHLHFHLLHLARLLCRPTQPNLKLHPNASPIASTFHCCIVAPCTPSQKTHPTKLQTDQKLHPCALKTAHARVGTSKTYLLSK